MDSHHHAGRWRRLLLRQIYRRAGPRDPGAHPDRWPCLPRVARIPAPSHFGLPWVTSFDTPFPRTGGVLHFPLRPTNSPSTWSRDTKPGFPKPRKFPPLDKSRTIRPAEETAWLVPTPCTDLKRLESRYRAPPGTDYWPFLRRRLTRPCSPSKKRARHWGQCSIFALRPAPLSATSTPDSTDFLEYRAATTYRSPKA